MEKNVLISPKNSGVRFMLVRSSMPGITALLALVMLIAAFFSGAHSERDVQHNAMLSRPQISGGLASEAPLWDMGEVDVTESPTLTHVFRIKNLSDTPVEIEKVSSSCGCFAVGSYKQCLQPGERLDIEVQLALSRVPGPFYKRLAVIPKGGEARALILAVSGTLKLNASLYSTPSLINFGVLKGKEKRVREVRLARYDGSPVQVRNVKFIPGNDCLSAEWSTLDDGRIALIKFCCKPNLLENNNYRQAVVVQTAHSTFQSLQIPLAIEVAPPDFGLIESVYVPALFPGEHLEVNLSKASVDRTTLTGIILTYTGDPGVNVERVVTDQDEDLIVRITRTDRQPVGRVVQGTIVVTSTMNEQRIEIPVTIFCPRSQGAGS